MNLSGGILVTLGAGSPENHLDNDHVEGLLELEEVRGGGERTERVSFAAAFGCS